MPNPWFSKTILDSGLTVLSSRTDSPSTTVIFMVKTGSKDEFPEEHGISHVLEHFVFRGTNRYKTSRDVMRALDSIGADHNAGTGKESTAYWVKAANEHLDRALTVLSEIVFHPTLPTALLEKEKGTILQEMAMYEDHPMAKVDDRFENLLYGMNSRLGRDIIGTQASIKSMKQDQLVSYRRRRYLPEHSVLTIAGGLNEREILPVVKKYFAGPWGITGSSDVSREPSTTFSRVRRRPAEKLGPLILRPATTRLVDTRDIDQVHLAIGVHGIKRGDLRRYALGIMLTILGGNASSQLFEEVREQRGWAYYIRSGAVKFQEDGFIVVRAGVPPEHARDVVSLVTGKFNSFSFTPAEFRDAKECLKGQLALGWEDSHTIADHLAEEHLFEREIRSYEEMVRKIEAVTEDEVTSVAHDLLRSKDIYLAAIGPVDEKLNVQKSRIKAQ